MSILDHALELAGKGFEVFPVKPGMKTPVSTFTQFFDKASTSPEKIRKWWEIEPECNIGISCTRFAGEHLIAIDVDTKAKADGHAEMLRLELDGFEFPPTYTQTTASGNKHLVYKVPYPVSQGTNVLAPGIDTRGWHGYIVGAGSIINGKEYTANNLPVADCPQWILDRVKKAKEREPLKNNPPINLDRERAMKTSLEWLSKLPVAVQGERNHKAYLAACKLKDFGLNSVDTLLAMVEWKCEPFLSQEELTAVVWSAFKTGQNEPGCDSPEAQFTPEEPSGEPEFKSPVERMNDNFAFVIAGGSHHILWETTDEDGRFKLVHLSEPTFHRLNAATVIITDDKTIPVSTLWIKAPARRSYDGIVFLPGRQAPERFYNLWRGFSVEPSDKASPRAHKALEMYLAHALENICQNDQELFGWLMNFFAHMVQRPWEKPLTAIVLRGGKGVGKNALIDPIGQLLGNHFHLTAKKRFLTGNFNAHLENCLFVAFDEAFWSGDKEAEGVLKDLITGRTHTIEYKGREPYEVRNCTRVAIMGNEEWVIPATNDERRFAVFDVGSARQQDIKYFTEMREGMLEGGLSLLLHHLLHRNANAFNVNQAPKTKALLDQKIASLDPFHQWWLECLTEGFIVGGHFESTWQFDLNKQNLRDAFKRYCTDRKIYSRIPNERSFGRMFKQVLPSVDATAKLKIGEEIQRVYRVPGLDEARKSWERFIGHDVQW